jgi:hypothetical protein
LDLEYWIGSKEIMYDISIDRLKEREDETEKEEVYYKGNLENCFWKSITFGYDSNWPN